MFGDVYRKKSGLNVQILWFSFFASLNFLSPRHLKKLSTYWQSPGVRHSVCVSSAVCHIRLCSKVSSSVEKILQCFWLHQPTSQWEATTKSLIYLVFPNNTLVLSVLYLYLWSSNQKPERKRTLSVRKQSTVWNVNRMLSLLLKYFSLMTAPVCCSFR